MKKILISCAAALITALSVQGTTRYVDYNDGADSGDGTAAPGWKTIAFAVATADAGDEIILAKGTHVCTTNLVIDKALHIHGAGENWETVFDAEHTIASKALPNVKIIAEGALVNNLTFYRLCGNKDQVNGQMSVVGVSTVSNCVFTGCGLADSGQNKNVIYMEKGIVTCCWITNNVCRYNPLVCIKLSSVMENCVVAGNRNYIENGDGLITQYTGTDLLRNCTIANNVLKGVKCAFYPQYGASGTVTAYNNIIYGNTNEVGEVRNYGLRRWWAGGVIHNDIKGPVRGDDGVYYTVNYVNPSNKNQYTGKENIEDDPHLDSSFAPGVEASATIKAGAKTGMDSKNVAYCTSCDIFGNPRGDKPSMGAVQYIAHGGLTVVVAADKTEVRLPEAIQLSCQIEGEQGALSYAWDYNNDGQIDSTEAAPQLATAGTYDSLKVTVTDTATSKIAYYNGTLTVLPRYMTNVVVSADKTAVRYPGKITITATIGDADAVGPYTYSWDLDGDGVEDCTDEHPVFEEIGSYANPTLLCVTDANGLYSDKAVLKGTYTILPETPQTYTVNVGDSFADAVSQAFDGDTILLKKGTHTFTGNVVVDRPIIISGEGENGETILDANHTISQYSQPHLKITAAGALVKNLTFYRLCGNVEQSGQFSMTGNSVVSNCVFTGCGISTSGSNNQVIYLSAGDMTCCWITNNVCRKNPMMSVRGSAILENCVVADNQNCVDNGDGLITGYTSTCVIRNNTIFGNLLKGTRSAFYPQYGSDGTVRAYNNIIYGNANEDGEVRNFGFRRWWAGDVVYNDVKGPVRGDDGVEYALNYKNPSNPSQGAGKDCFEDDPCLNEGYAPTASAATAIKEGARTGTDTKGNAYCTTYDIYGKARGDKPSLGAIQYVASSKLSVAINADKTTARPPETIVLKAVVEGTESENITYAWDIDGDGEFDDGTDPTNILNMAGNYEAVKVRISADGEVATAAYDGTLTVYLDVAIYADATKVRQPGVITFSAEVADAEAAQPFIYSWDLNGDGVEDSAEANPTLSAIGEYVNPTLLRITDANGLVSDKIVLKGSYTVMTEVPQTFTVNPVDSLADVLAHAFDGDVVILKKGTHSITNAITIRYPVTICGEGAKEDTVIDGTYSANMTKKWPFTISAAGARVCNLTFTRFAMNDYGQIRLYADAVVSNVVVTGCGYDSTYCGTIVEMRSGLLTHCWITNNVASRNAGVQIQGNSTMENCAILNNRSTYGEAVDGSALDFEISSGAHTVRNCTIAGNTFAHTNGVAVYGYCYNANESVHLYNTIIWSNTCTKVGAIHPNVYNANTKKWFVKNNCWDYNDLSRLCDPTNGTNVCSILVDPKFDIAKGGAPILAAESPCRNKGDDNYAPTGLDLLGNRRKVGRHVDIGAVENEGVGFAIILR